MKHTLHSRYAFLSLIALVLTTMYPYLQANEVLVTKNYPYAIEENTYAPNSVFIFKGLDLNAQDAEGFTALHKAAEEGDSHKIKELLKAGANQLIPENSGNIYPLHCAILGGHLECARILLNHSGYSEADKKQIISPLMLSMRKFYERATEEPPVSSELAKAEKICTLLLSHPNVSPNEEIGQGITALHIAGLANSELLVTLLLNKNANAYAPNNAGIRPVDIKFVQSIIARRG